MISEALNIVINTPKRAQDSHHSQKYVRHRVFIREIFICPEDSPLMVALDLIFDFICYCGNVFFITTITLDSD